MKDSVRPEIGATVLGYPRIGPDRELKRAIEGYWAGRTDPAALFATATDLRAKTLAELAGLDSVPGNTFSFYDHVLDTAVLFGAVPQRFRDLGLSELDTYFAMARGHGEVAPLELTKWFDTNYHYLVPELGPDTRFDLVGGQAGRRVPRGGRPRRAHPAGARRPAHLPAAGQARAGRSTGLRAARPARRARRLLRAPARPPRRRGRDLGAAGRARVRRRPERGRTGRARPGLRPARRAGATAPSSWSRATSATSAPRCPSWPTRPSRRSRSTWCPRRGPRNGSRRCAACGTRRSSPVSSTGATSGAPTSAGRSRPAPRCSARSGTSRSPRRARCCTCPTTGTPRPDWIPRCATASRSPGRRSPR